jgi:hypothetical protein
VYPKDSFKIIVGDPNILVAPTKTGNDTTWKVVSIDKTDKDVAVGDAYTISTVKSQTGVTVFDFSITQGTSRVGRLVFEDGDNYILIAMPAVSNPGDSALTDGDLAAYKIILSNIAKTIRVPSTSSSASSSNSSSASGTSDSSSSSSSSSVNSDSSSSNN